MSSIRPVDSPGKRLRSWRLGQGLTLNQLAERVGCCDWTALSHIEREERMPGRRIANGIERVTGIASTDWDAWEDAKKGNNPGGEAA